MSDSSQNINELVRLVETWQHQKKAVFEREQFKDGTNPKSLHEFNEIHNRLSRQLVSIFAKGGDPDFFDSLTELSVHAARIVAGGKTFINGQDVTSKGM